MPPSKKRKAPPPALPSSSNSNADPPPTPEETPPLPQITEPEEIPGCPACPGFVKIRPPASRQSEVADAFQTFTALRRNEAVSDEEAYLMLITCYDASKLSFQDDEKLDVSFSKVKYEQVARYVWLEPEALGDDMLPLKLFKSRIPNRLFHQITRDARAALTQYGPLVKQSNEEVRSRFITSLFSEIICIFDGTIVNKPERLLESNICRKGRIEHNFHVLGSLSVVFVEVKRELLAGDGGLDVKGQVLAECAACDFANQKLGYWTPILAILCDGNDVEFFVYDSADQVVYDSDWVDGITMAPSRPDRFHAGLKYVAELFLDWFAMAYVNGIRAYFTRSSTLSFAHKRDSTEKWENALRIAELGRAFLRTANSQAAARNWTEAENLASRGIELLRESVQELPRTYRRQEMIDLGDCSQSLEQILIDGEASGTVRLLFS